MPRPSLLWMEIRKVLSYSIYPEATLAVLQCAGYANADQNVYSLVAYIKSINVLTKMIISTIIVGLLDLGK